mgnify:CR=1 FL=1
MKRLLLTIIMTCLNYSYSANADCIKYLSPPVDKSNLFAARAYCSGRVIFSNGSESTYHAENDYSWAAGQLMGGTLGVASLGLPFYHASVVSEVAKICKSLYEEHRFEMCPEGKIGKIIDSKFEDVDVTNPNQIPQQQQ